MEFYAVVVILIILLEIAVMALVWTAINRKDFKEDIKGKAKAAMQEMVKNEKQFYFMNLIQAQLHCCGIDNSDDYGESRLPQSCIDKNTGYPYEQGCLDTLVQYLKSKASILGGVAIAVFILQLAALVMTVCLACAIKNSATNSIF